MTDTDKHKAERIPTYKDAEGNYLVVIDHREGFKLAWFIPEDGDVGGELETDKTFEEDYVIAVKAARAFCNEHGIEVPERGAFVFPSASRAKECLKRIHAALWAWKKSIPLPDWAQKAIEAGWTPPKGWRP